MLILLLLLAVTQNASVLGEEHERAGEPGGLGAVGGGALGRGESSEGGVESVDQPGSVGIIRSGCLPRIPSESVTVSVSILVSVGEAEDVPPELHLCLRIRKKKKREERVK